MKSFIKKLGSFAAKLKHRTAKLWKRYRALPVWQQAAIALVVVAIIVGAIVLLKGNGGADESGDKQRTVTLATVAELSGNGGSVDLIGSVRSVTEADLLAQNGGTVRALHTKLGGTVPAGFVIAELENAAERASVLQAEGSYDAAVAARSAQSLPDTQNTTRTTYRSAYTTLDDTLQTQVDQFFGDPTAVGPDLLITPKAEEAQELSRERARLDTVMASYAGNLAGADSREPAALLDETESVARQIATFLTKLSNAANERDAQTTPAQTAALVAARASVDGVLAGVQAARNGYRAGSVGASASADAQVKQALGSLRAAQANLERTVVRAPIAGQVNFLPIRVGDYVTPMMHVATVAQNGALEIVAYVSEGDRDLLVAGNKVTVEGTYDGVITSVAPALDPVTKQIEVHIAVSGESSLVNGQSVRIALPDSAPKATATEPAGPTLLPLTALKLTSSARVVFSVGEDGRLVAHAVEIGDVRGDRIEILTQLPTDLRIVSDARGLSEGQQVAIAGAADNL